MLQGYIHSTEEAILENLPEPEDLPELPVRHSDFQELQYSGRLRVSQVLSSLQDRSETQNR